IRVTDACEQCGHCTAVCTSNVIVHAEVKQYGMVVDPGCMKCMDCISVCPTNALYYGFGKPAFALPKATKAKTVTRHYSLTWPEEIASLLIFLGSFLGVRAAYGLVPFLMALGVASVTTFLALKAWRLFTTREVYLHRFILKSAGAWKKAGLVFVLFALAWIALNAHTAFIHYQENAGDKAFQSLRLPDELALAQTDPRPFLSPADRTAVASGTAHYQNAEKFGFFQNSDALAKLAWFEFLSGHAPRAVDLLGRAAAGQKGEAKALSLYYRGALQSRLGQFRDALVNLDAALAERPDLILARQEKGEALWRLGEKTQAIDIWQDAIRRNPNLILTNDQLASAYRLLGQSAAADAAEAAADSATPNDPLYHLMLALRLRNVGMLDLAQKHFQQANALDPRLRNLGSQ
ncbi:MAG: 4Fe-4S dicluster domain-containing protein, partial [Chthoniobacterales bacterium]